MQGLCETAQRPFPMMKEGLTREVLDEIVRLVKSVRYGTVQIVIHDAKIVEIDKTEKLRLGSSKKTNQTTGGPSNPTA
jgi:hypothetical protein